MVPNTIKVPVPFEYVWPHGALFLGVEPVTDFDKRGQGDDQARDKDTGERLWVVRSWIWTGGRQVRRVEEVKVKIAAPVQPVPPASKFPGYPPAKRVHRRGASTPYVDKPAVQGHGEVPGASGVVNPRRCHVGPPS